MGLIQKFIIWHLLIHVGMAIYKEQHRPCFFNPLCTCSNAGPDLGSVSCYDVPFVTIPTQINSSAIYIMSFKNNMLQTVEENSLNGTGMWKLEINHNLLTDLKSKSLFGLGKTLSILDLSHNHLVRIPKEAIEQLEKLQILSLAWNHISVLETDDIFQLGKNLKVFDLSGNSLIYIHNDAFRNMLSLEVLNLASNSIMSIDNMFQTGTQNLKEMNLMGNQLQYIPLTALMSLKNLKVINLSNNFISSISDGTLLNPKISLEELHLEYNVINHVADTSFKSFSVIDRIYLNGNPLTSVEDKAFSTVNTTEIHLSKCKISEISTQTFEGVENSLQVLDLSFNNLTTLPKLHLRKLKILKLQGNEIHNIQQNTFTEYETILQYLDVSGINMGSLSSSILGRLQNIRSLSFNKQHNNAVQKDDFLEIGPALEKLSLVRNDISSIENGAFDHLLGLKHLDISYNNIRNIGNVSFKDIGHSLEKLVAHNALELTIYPSKALRYLLKLQYLDLSSNEIRHMPKESLVPFQNIKYINLNHNNIMELNFTYTAKISNPNLLHFKIAFNKLKMLPTNVFNQMRSLAYLDLSDNLISSIQKSAFVDLDSLIYIKLEGNNIKNIEKEAFQNLPKIQLISLSYNELQNFDLEAFDLVGRLSSLQVLIDHNHIQQLSRNNSSVHTSSNVKIMNFSHNNITTITENYFDSVRHSLNSLDLSYNHIECLTNSALADMSHLRVLTIAHNKVCQINDTSLMGLKQLQVLDMSNNNIQELPEELFVDHQSLRILNVSKNYVSDLPDEIFQETLLEQLDLSKNEIAWFPEQSLRYVNNTLQYLDLSENYIAYLNFSNLEHLGNLKQLILSNNELQALDYGILKHLHKLITLDLSSNNFEHISATFFESVPKSLENINLANTSLTSIPNFDTPHVLELNFSHNSIKIVHPDALRNLSKIQSIDLSHNRLPISFSHVWNNLPHLRILYLCGNPLKTINNDSFINLKRLQELHIKDLELYHIDNSAFLPLISLRKLEMSTYPQLREINIANMLSGNKGLREIHLHVQEPILTNAINGNVPKSLKKITLEGKKMKEIDEMAFEMIRSKDLTLEIHNSNITRFTEAMFEKMKEVENLTATFRNNKLETLERITAVPETKVSTKHLKKLDLQGNYLVCDCALDWIWDWINEYEYELGCTEMDCREDILKSLRETTCLNKQNDSIISVFKTDLQCNSKGWTINLFITYFYVCFGILVVFVVF